MHPSTYNNRYPVAFRPGYRSAYRSGYGGYQQQPAYQARAAPVQARQVEYSTEPTFEYNGATHYLHPDGIYRVTAPEGGAQEGTQGAVGGARGLGPAWTRGEAEQPAGKKDMGTWTAAVYTEEQQARLGVDEEGKPVSAPRQMVGGSAGVGPAWTRGEAEAPAGEKNMGSWTARVYTEEQQERLNVDEFGKPRPKMVGGGAGSVGPAWTRGEAERPAGSKDMGTWTAQVYTEEQQERLNVDEFGQPAGGAQPKKSGMY